MVAEFASEAGAHSPVLHPPAPMPGAGKALALPRAARHVVVAGFPDRALMRSLRLATRVATRLDLTTFASEREAVDHALARVHAAGLPPAHLERLRRIPRVDLRAAKRLWGMARRRPLAGELSRRQARAGAAVPRFAGDDAPWLSLVVPVHDARPRHLRELLRSVVEQSAGRIELVLSDDASRSRRTRRWLNALPQRVGEVEIVRLRARRNGGIARATRAGIGAARGVWIGLLDHDDVLMPHVLAAARAAIAARPEAKLVYTDEVTVDDRARPRSLMAKPAFDPVLLTGVNFVNHLGLYRRDRLAAIGGMREGYDGSQDYDLALRFTRGLADREIVHLPYPGYGWRRTGDTYSVRHIERATQNARAAIAEHLALSLPPHWRLDGVEPALTPTLHRPIVVPARGRAWPGVTVVVPSREAPALVETVTRGVLDETDYPDIELVVVDNGSTSQAVLDLYEARAAEDARFRFDIVDEPFNFSRSVNRGIAKAGGRHVLLLNDDVEIEHPGWLKEMVSCLALGTADHPVGIVGAKLVYPNRTIQHAGVTVGVEGLAVHAHAREPEDARGPLGALHVRRSVTCVTGATMLLSAATVERLGPWDEENFAVAYNDVDYCMRAWKAGIRTVWTPFATLVHHESLSRGPETGAAKRARFEREKASLRRIHGTDAFGDPACASAAFAGADRSDGRPTLATGREWFEIT